ncbi:hypothetical protein [Aeromicrobium alkaliterrae]|uniref:Uncharacterized protein n=1 Tax=Aeromicrobium alkaliterrae TaxID=302168 RepID=A0ABN2JLQ6_9ACTN
MTTTIEYPRSSWDAQRAAHLAALSRARWSTCAAASVVALGAIAVVARSDGPAWLLAGLVWGAVMIGVVRTVVRRVAGRGVGDDLAQALAESGTPVSREQVRVLLGIGSCWLADYRYLSADLSSVDQVVLTVTDAPADVVATHFGESAGGFGGVGGDGGGC